MPELVGFQTMVILDPYGMTFDVVGVFGLVFWLLFKSGSSYCVLAVQDGKYGAQCKLWQYGLWGFQSGGTKLDRFLPKN